MSRWAYCLEKDNGTLATGWNKIGEFWYYMNAFGVMQRSWMQICNDWYYLNENGQMVTGWLQDGSKWYYFNASGVMYKDVTTVIDGKTYIFDNGGVMSEPEVKSLVSDEAVDSIKSWEGYFATPYYDCVGVLTLGYGMTGTEITGIASVTEAEATIMLKSLIDNKYANVVKADLDSRGLTLAQNEFDALVSFAYNCGTDGLLGSTLYRNVVAGVRDPDIITGNFQAWSNGGGKRIEGLYRRRTKEAAMFLVGDYTGNN